MPPTLDYTGKLVLAPMVRVSELPLRALSLKYGADLVWGPEIVDKRLIASRCVENKELGTTDFILIKDASKLTWRTAPSLEKSRVIFQLGTSDPGLAVQAAKMVAPYVAGIDLNSGCPKHFSVHSGMGSQLLYAPEKLISILTSLVDQVGTPYGVAISVKIRILDTAQKTYDLVKQLVHTGIKCLTVHCRTPDMRPRKEAAVYDQLTEIARICRDANVACLVNGDIEHRGQLQSMIDTYGVSGAMIARGSETNPSCFAGPELAPQLKICREFLDLCIKYDYNVSHMKYNLTNMVSGRDALYQKFARAKTAQALNEVICEAEAIHKTDVAKPEQPKQERNETPVSASHDECGRTEQDLSSKKRSPTSDHNELGFGEVTQTAESKGTKREEPDSTQENEIDRLDPPAKRTTQVV